MSAPTVLMRAVITFRLAGEPVLKGSTFYVDAEQAVGMLQSGHAVAVYDNDIRLLAQAAGVQLHRRRHRGFIGGEPK
jgi:hypothetical protein